MTKERLNLVQLSSGQCPHWNTGQLKLSGDHLGTKIFNNIFAPALVGKEVDYGKVEVRSVQLPINFLVLEDHLQFKNGITDACSTADCLVKG